MTPSLFDLPLRVGDALPLAEILIQALGAQPNPVSDDVRARVAGRVGGLRSESMRPLTASIERDPVHPSAYYICVDGVDNQPLLLRVAPASTPSSGLFPKAILIGRSRIGATEAVLNAVPFGPGDADRIAAFAENVNKVFLPRSPASRPVVRVRCEDPANGCPVAFEGFRKLLRAGGRNLAAFSADEGQVSREFVSAVIWAAIRTGWREGFAIESARMPLVVSRDIDLKVGMGREEILSQF